jgi:hypothetical protein
MKQLLLVALSAMFLSACAASGSIQTLSANAPAVDTTKSGGVQVSTALSDKAESLDAFRNAIITQLVNKRVFGSIADTDNSDYVIQVNVVELSEVSQGARIFFGALAGQAGVTANVDIYDRREGRTVSSMVAKGTSSGGHVFAGTTQEAFDQAAAQISDYLLRSRKL